MKRLTSDNTFEMNMHQLALNQVYIGKDGRVQYAEGPERECSVCDLIRTASEALDVELPMLSDEALSDLLLDWLQYGAEEPEGVVAILYRALCAMAEVRAQLFRYEDTGLEPEEVSEYQRLCDSYVKAGLDAKFVQFCIDATQNGLSMDRIRELAQAEKDGRLVVLPCKVGTPVWEIGDFDGGNLKKRPFSVEDMSFWRFGGTVFLTRKEAEAALKKRERDEP